MLMYRQVSVALILAVLTIPLAHAQQASADVTKRVDKLEAEMRAVQRKVFPGGPSKYFEPEVQQGAPAETQPPAAQAEQANADLLIEMQNKIAMLERQIADMTGQVEQANFQARRAQDELAKFRGDVEFRLGQLEGGGAAQGAAATPGAAPMPGTAPVPGVGTPARTTPAKPGDPKPFPPEGVDPASPAADEKPVAGPVTPEEQYKAAFAYVTQKDHARAEAALRTFIEKNPKSPRASDAYYWLGRTYMVQKQFAPAAKAFLDGWQAFPKAERAPEQLLGLADALMGLGKGEEACRAYNELEAGYPKKITGTIKTRLEQGRQKAKCAA